MNETVSTIAFSDISKYVDELTDEVPTKNDIWFVRPVLLNTKENRRLNSLLGLRNINYTSENMNRRKK